MTHQSIVNQLTVFCVWKYAHDAYIGSKENSTMSFGNTRCRAEIKLRSRKIIKPIFEEYQY